MSAKSDRQMLEALVKAGERFRRTPIVDDDFLTVKHSFDLLLAQAAEWLGRPLTAVDEQPSPVSAEGDCWLAVIEDMRQRREHGIAKYRVPLQVGNGRKSLVDAYQEALDMVVYLKQALEERNNHAAS